MSTVTISPKYQVVIPKEVRGFLNLKPGQKLEVFHFDNRIELIPVEPIETAMGFLKDYDIDTSDLREKDTL